MELTEKQWNKIFEILNRYTKPSPIGKGRPRQNDNKILQGSHKILRHLDYSFFYCYFFIIQNGGCFAQRKTDLPI